jgi:hypothetical protein
MSDSQSYTFDVTPGTYSLTEGEIDGWDFTRAYCNDESKVDSVHVGTGETVTCTFVNTQRGSISGHKLNDADGKYETSDDRNPLSGWTIKLYMDGNLLGSRVTDVNGDYSFENLLPGTYTLKEGVEAGWMILSPTDNYITVNLEEGENDTDNDFINVKYPQITVYKNVDTDGDNEIEERDVKDWQWKLNEEVYGMGVTSNMTLPGTYTISEVQKDGYSAMSLVCGETNYGAVESAEITVSSGDIVTCTFTNTREVGSIKVNKSVDLNGDGDWKDKDEESNNKAKALGFKWSMDNGSSKDMGSMEFNVPTGSHTITEKDVNKYHFVSWYYSQEEGRSCTNPNGRELPITVDVTKGNRTEITLCNAVDTGSVTIVKDAVNDSHEEFEFNTNLPVNHGSFKLEDDGDNNDGKKNSITVTVPVGTYNVEEKEVAGWKLTDLKCTGDNNSSVYLEHRKATLKIDEDELVTCTFTNTELGSISGVKFNDKDGDAVKDWHESTMKDWTIFIDKNGNKRLDKYEMSDKTNHDGKYSFDNLLPGTYSVCEKMQEGWYNSTPICQNVELGVGDNEKVDFGNHQALKIVASKIVCDTEADLPNWGNGAPNIDSKTAEKFVRSNPNCHLESGWDFEWGYDRTVSQEGGSWQLLGTTDHHGKTDLLITNAEDLRTIWVRENLKPGYVGFSNNIEDSYSAEMYCSTDGLNYDNYDKVETLYMEIPTIV